MHVFRSIFAKRRALLPRICFATFVFFPTFLLPDLKAEHFFSPLSEITASFFFAGENNHLMENRDGTILRKGGNLLIYESGKFQNGAFSLNYQLKQTLNKTEKKIEIHRFFANYLFGRFQIEAGKNNAEAGPGENKLLLSKNCLPYFLLKAKTQKPLNLWGKWNFFILNGWLHEKRNDVSNPQIFVFRISYSPYNFIEIGGMRSTLHAGNGRPKYKIWEYPYLLLGVEENITGSKWDNDGYAAYDITIKIPEEKLPDYLDELNIYYQDAGTDMAAFWQKEDKKYYFPLGFRLQLHAYLAGIFIKTRKNSCKLEFTATNPLFYTHHWYHTEGYSYKGASIGLPYGRNSQNFTFTHYLKFRKIYNITYKLGFLRQPAFNAAKEMKRYYAIIKAGKEFKEKTIELFLRFDKTENYDASPQPNQYSVLSGNKRFITAGISYTFK